MEVRPGYKQTELGVIPEDWAVEDIAACAESASGTTPARAAAERYFHDGTIPWVKTLDLNNSVIKETDECVTETALRETSLKLYPAGSVLVAMYGGFAQIGRTGYLPFPATINQALTAICPEDRKLDSKYLIYFLNYHVGYWKSVASSSRKDPNITGNDVRKFPISLPPIKEQRAIATALSDADALLDGLTRLIAKKRDLKQATMQQLLTGQTRLPGFSGEWEVKRIGEFTDCSAGGTPSTKIAEYWNGAIPWMNSGELNLKQVYAVEGRITEAGLANSSTKMIPAKCVLIGLAGQGKTRGTVAMNHLELCTNQSIAAIFPNESFIPEYLYYNLDNRYDELRELSMGDGGRGGLNLRIIKSISLPFPPVTEQSAIATVLSGMDAELAALDARLTKTRALKQAMMSELLTGKTRLRT